MTLGDAEVTAMRTTTAAALPDTCTISRDTPTADELGGETSVWAPVAVNVPCRYAPDQIADGERERGGRIASTNGWRFTFAQGTDVRPPDQLVVGTRTFEVVSVDARRSWELATVVRCIEIT